MQNMLKALTRESGRCGTDADRAVRKYAPIVYRIVRQVADRTPSSVDRENLFSAGMVGLLDALAKYDESRGIAFEAYARIRIKGAILDELRGLDHLTRTMRRRSRSIRDTQDDLQKSGLDSDDQSVAEATGMSLAQVQKSRARRAAPEVMDPSSLEAISVRTPWAETGDVPNLLAASQRIHSVSEALTRLPERHRMVVAMYYEAELTLQEIGEILDVTQSRVSQILRKTVELLRDSVGDAV